MISVEGLNKIYPHAGRELHVLKDITFNVDAGEMTAMMGPSGVGKSTLLHILGALDRPTSGSITYNGRDVFTMSNEMLAGFRNSTVGFVFQFHHLLPEFNTIENVMMPALIAGLPFDRARTRAEKVLHDVGLGERLEHKPGELSGGEQQRVAIARALMPEPSIVLADEPTGNLDSETGDEVFALMRQLNRGGMTFVIVTHNEGLAAQCGRIIHMKDGRIVEHS